ncbi:MAG TPA: AraC family transcriptional regulator [Chloroflexia bacterium]|nr:AraC family transcriptional regulator [Chloroflexia bacterium]
MLDNLHIRIFVAKWTKINTPFWKLKNVQSTYWRFYLNQAEGASLELDKGAGSTDKAIYPLEKDHAYFIPAGVRFNTDIAHEVGHFFVHFDVLGMPEIAMRAIFNYPICLPPSARLQKAVYEIIEDLQTGQPVDLVLECRVKAVIYEGLALYLQLLPSEQLKLTLQLAVALKPVLPAINYINNNLARTILNPELARLCKMNEDYFIRRFKECMGQTPGEYIREQRVRLAAQQLLFSASSIEQIATASGFGSRFYLSRVFKAATGLSPAAYRKATRV